MRKLKGITLFLIVCLLITPVQWEILAESTHCQEKNVTILGYTYCYSCGIQIENDVMQAFATVKSPTHVNYPTGYYGIKVIVYNDSGTIVIDNDWFYNPESNITGRTIYSNTISEQGTYYSKAQMRFYNGNGYNTYNCNASPCMQRSSGVPVEEYKVNENGQTYGSDFYAETIDEMPDLVRVLGINGREGYVYKTQLEWVPESLEEVLEYIHTGADSKTIPVYLEDGITIIDSFVITKPELESEILR